MLVQKVKLTVVGEPVAYLKKENGTPLKTPDGQDVVGYRRQVVFESRDYKKDSILFTLFSDGPEPFPFTAGMDGDLQFLCEIREANSSQEGEKRYYTELRLINFNPTN